MVVRGAKKMWCARGVILASETGPGGSEAAASETAPAGSEARAAASETGAAGSEAGPPFRRARYTILRTYLGRVRCACEPPAGKE